jgi:DNA-binding NarL/FixJ family response regulator
MSDTVLLLGGGTSIVEPTERIEKKVVSKSISILIASAQATFRQEMRTRLESEKGIVAFEQQDGPQIVDQIQELQPDLLLLDLDTETSAHFDLVSTISRQCPNVKIVVRSGPGQEGQVLDALRNGAHGHLPRGANDLDQIVAALRAVGRGESILSPAIAGMVLDEIGRRYQLMRSARPATGTPDRIPGSTPVQRVAE